MALPTSAADRAIAETGSDRLGASIGYAKVIARRRGMAGRHQRIDETLVVRGELHRQGFEVAVPLRLGTGAGDGGADQTVVQHPGQGEGDRGRVVLDSACRDGLGDLQRFRPPLGLLHALVATAGTAVGWRRRVHGVLAREHAARQRAVRNDTQAVVARGGQLLDFGRAIDDVVERLAGDRTVDAELVGDARHFGNAPAAEIGQAEVPHLALADQVAHGAYAFFERQARDCAMEIQQVDVVGAQALEAGLHRLVDPAARLALLVRAGRTRRREAELGGDHPAVAVVGDGA
ncbi:hypothetical protein G6F65_017724 [Rhizopus arrhizus]|nr:hypothetical protein G6F65_017724 [Rhizopus arrhizus]